MKKKSLKRRLRKQLPSTTSLAVSTLSYEEISQGLTNFMKLLLEAITPFEDELKKTYLFK